MKIIQKCLLIAMCCVSFHLEGAATSDSDSKGKKSRVGKDYLDSGSEGEHEDQDDCNGKESGLKSLTDDPENTRGLLDFFTKKKKKQSSVIDQDQAEVIEASNDQLMKEVERLNDLLDRVQGIMVHDSRAQSLDELVARFERAILSCMGHVDLERDLSHYFDVRGNYHQASDTIEIFVDRSSPLLGRWEREGVFRITEREAKELLARLAPAVYSRLGGHRITWKVLGLEGFPQQIEDTLKKIIDDVLDEKYKTGLLLRQIQEDYFETKQASHSLGTFTVTTRYLSLWDHLIGQMIHKGKLVSLRDGRPISLRLVPHACVAQVVLLLTLWAVYDLYEYPVASTIILAAGLVFVYRYLRWIPREL